VDVDEALRTGLVVRVTLVVGGEVEVVQRLAAAPAVDRDVAAVQDKADLAGDVLLGVVDERLQRALQREYQRPS
jgi:hypothetical protein